MNEIFKSRVEEITEPVEQIKIETKPEVGEGITPNTPPEENTEFKDLEIWEGENKKKYVNEYFDTHNIAHEFIWKMPIAQIDKFVRAEIEKREYAKTTDNYKNILAEIENEIGSNKLELYTRLRKITGYINALSKLYKARELKSRYLIPEIQS